MSFSMAANEADNFPLEAGRSDFCDSVEEGFSPFYARSHDDSGPGQKCGRCSRIDRNLPKLLFQVDAEKEV